MRVKLFAYSLASQTSKDLASALGIKRLRHTGSTFEPRKDDVVINWGHCGKLLDGFNCTILNKPKNVSLCSNKLKFFQSSEEREQLKFLTVPYTASKEVALSWLQDGKTVIARTVLNGNSGEGIVVLTTPDQLINAQLYTMYIPKKEEYRVHIMRGGVIDLQRKIKDPNKEITDWHVRNHDSGFIFVRNNLTPNPKVIEYALNAMTHYGLDFGAVDVIYNGHRNEAYVLEINTAPGLENTTLENYVNGFKALLGV
jgi:glutathione synthase/RimK-type ligase-like ATP-grasp enzyme